MNNKLSWIIFILTIYTFPQKMRNHVETYNLYTKFAYTYMFETFMDV